MAVLVTGATGTVGKDVAAQLAENGAEVRRAVLPAEVETATGPGAAVAFDFTDPTTHASALDGVDRVFLMRPPPMSNVKRDMRPFIAAMAERHVRLVAFLSLMGVNRAMPHWQIEQDLRSAQLPSTMLRPSFFTQNLSSAYRDDIAVHDRIRLPAGSGRTSFVDTRDVAAVAAAALTDPDTHAGHAYTITGDRAYSYDQVAALLSSELGRQIRYERIGFLRYRRELNSQHLPSDYVRVQLLINAVARIGLAKKTTSTVADVTGHAPTPLPETIHRLRDAWRRPA